MAQAVNFDPRSAEQFAFGRWSWNPEQARLTLGYRLDSVAFEEELRFPGARPPPTPAHEEALARCFELVHLLSGVSYYKAAVPREIGFDATPPAPMLASFTERVYRNGLGEFAYRNGLDLRERIHVPSGDPEAEPDAVPLERGVVVPLGGGKDSLVSVDAVQRSGRPFRVISVGQAPLIDEVAAAVGVEHLRIERRLSPRLLELNAAGAYNGHVPITAILAAVLAAGALLYGYDQVVMSNEAAADEANLVLDDGFEVNHQYSKSLRFERDFQAVVQARVLPGLRYFSLLRPLSELEIARRFAAARAYHRVFSSCNRNFRLAGPAGGRWCRDCPKCRFVFLALAPFLPRETLQSIFGGNLLDETAQLDGYRALLGLCDIKPFECVGEIEECRSALRALARRPDWQDCAVVVALSGEPRVREARPLDSWLGQRGPSTLDPDWLELLDATG